MEDEKITRAPFSDEQVDSLNHCQQESYYHPFTCGSGDQEILVAQNQGWTCPKCNYTQDWAYTYMANWSWKKPIK